jgi:hypothetical protein
MEKIIKLSSTEVPLSLHRAKVIHANKYSETNAAWGYRFMFSNLYTDVVFRANEDGTDYKAYIKNLDLPVYTEQDVTILCADNIVLGYIDMQTNYYYYTSKDFQSLLGLGISVLWIWLAGILAGAAIYFFNHKEFTLWLYIPLMALYLFCRVQKIVFNYRIKKAIDQYLG